MELSELTKDNDFYSLNLFLRIKDKAVYIEVIRKSSLSQLNIFHVLLQQFFYDLKNGFPTEQHTFLNIEQLAKRLNIDPMTTENLERKVRKPLNRMQKAIKEKLTEELRLCIKTNDIIECLHWSGRSCGNYGYRINPFFWKISAFLS